MSPGRLPWARAAAPALPGLAGRVVVAGLVGLVGAGLPGAPVGGRVGGRAGGRAPRRPLGVVVGLVVCLVLGGLLAPRPSSPPQCPLLWQRQAGPGRVILRSWGACLVSLTPPLPHELRTTAKHKSVTRLRVHRALIQYPLGI